MILIGLATARLDDDLKGYFDKQEAAAKEAKAEAAQADQPAKAAEEKKE